MHTSFTSYHTIGILFLTTAIIFILSKLLGIDLKSIYNFSNIIKLLVVALLVTGISIFYSYQYPSGMNKMKVFGFPRGFYQIRTEAGAVQTKFILYRYALENVVVWFCLCSLIFFLFKLVTAGKK
jgi:uncharacterized membrane protein